MAPGMLLAYRRLSPSKAGFWRTGPCRKDVFGRDALSAKEGFVSGPALGGNRWPYLQTIEFEERLAVVAGGDDLTGATARF